MKKTLLLLSSALAMTLALPGHQALADGFRLVPVSLHLPHGARSPCEDAPRFERISTGRVAPAALAAYAEAIGACDGRVGVSFADAGEVGLTYLPTRVLPDGGWVSELDGARLVRMMEPRRRDSDFQPASAIPTRGPDAVVEDTGPAGDPEGFIVSTDDPGAAEWYRSATAWVSDPDRLRVAEGGSVLATCSGASGTCLVTIPVCAGVAVGFEARGAGSPSTLGPEVMRAYRDAAEAIGCGTKG